MKLSEDLLKCMYASKIDNFLAAILTKKAAQLESDSRMLEDLIEMLKEQVTFHLTDWEGKYEWLLAARGKIYDGHTPREAIAAAIKEWKKK